MREKEKGESATYVLVRVIFVTPLRCCVDRTLAARSLAPQDQERRTTLIYSKDLSVQEGQFSVSKVSGASVSGSDSRSKTLQPARSGDEHLGNAQIVSVFSGTAISSVPGNGVLHSAAGDDTKVT